MFTLDLPERVLYFSLNMEHLLVHEAVQPLMAVQSLYLREHCLDRVELWAVSHVEHGSDVQLYIVLFYLRCFVNRCTIKEQSKRLPVHLLRKQVNEVREVSTITRLFLHLKMEHSFLSDCSYHVSIVSAHILLVDTEVGVLAGPLPLNK